MCKVSHSMKVWILPLLAVVGVGLGVYEVVHRSRPDPSARLQPDTWHPPFPSFVAGSGIIESNTENIAVGTNIAGIVASIDVHVGSQVKQGDPLFSIDALQVRSERAAVQAGIHVAQIQLASAAAQNSRTEHLGESAIMSVEAVDDRRFAQMRAEAVLAQANTRLNVIDTELNRLVVRAPIDGQILQLKVHLGEFAPVGQLSQPLVLMGNVEPLHVRVDVDEHDAWRVRSGAQAMGFLRSNTQITAPLVFVRFEPYVIPKVSLTGASAERVDTRVLQVIYRFHAGDLPVFVGQQLDICIEATARSTAGTEH